MGDWCSRGCGFESWHRILDGHFFALICYKNCIVCLKRPKINEKEAEVGPFFKKTHTQCALSHVSKSCFNVLMPPPATAKKFYCTDVQTELDLIRSGVSADPRFSEKSSPTPSLSQLSIGGSFSEHNWPVSLWSRLTSVKTWNSLVEGEEGPISAQL